MSKPTRPPISSAELVYLSALVIHQLIQNLPKGTSYSIGIVLIVMMSGRLVECKGSLARAVWPLVMHLKWGWHRVERAMERGHFCLDSLIEQAYSWSLHHLEVEPIRLGPLKREVLAADSTTIARLRSQARSSMVWGKGYTHRVGHAVRANVAAALVSVVLVRGTRVGLLRSLRFGPSAETAIKALFEQASCLEGFCLILVDAGIATKEQFAAATHEQGLAGRLRKNCSLRSAPPPATGKRGRPPLHGPRVHPGWINPEVKASEEWWIPVEGRIVRLRCWRDLHYEGYHQTRLDVLRVDDPAFTEPLLVATTARELSIIELYQAYPHRSPVETLFYVAQDSCATEMPRAWTDTAVERRIGLGLLAGSLLKAIAAMGESLPIGPWDKKPMPTAGRLAYHLNLHLVNFAALALKGVKPRNYRKKPQAPQAQGWSWKKAA